jgi:eukaryotic-like serine/threonine-protein kinase
MVGQADSTDALLGRVIADAYVIQELLGIGGMGRVYRAEQRALGRMVAVKVVHKHLLGDKDSVSRFYTEARAASSLNHPNSVSIFDFGRTDDGMLYLVMEHLRGKDLARVMHDEPQLSLTRIVEIGLGVLGALGEAHARGVVHRDLKPENVILERMRGGEGGRLWARQDPRARAGRGGARPGGWHARLHVSRAGARHGGRWAR